MAVNLDQVRMGLSALAFVVYCAVGYVVGRRMVSRESMPANRAFQAWWFGLAVITIFTPLMYLLDASDAPFSSMLVALQFALVLIVVAIGALVYYLLYVWSGRSGIFWPVAAYHLAVLVWLMYLITWGNPYDYGTHCAEAPATAATFCYTNDISTGQGVNWLSLSITLPILLSAIAYFGLFFRVNEPEQKYRIALVAGALIFWFGSSLLANIAKLADRVPYWSLISTSISVLAALLIFFAYRPPRFVRSRLRAGSPGG